MLRAGTSTMIAKLNMNGSGEAIHIWNRDQTAAMTLTTIARRGPWARPV